ncbi:MAG TPA: N-acetylmuramoyl-L-alanine amidase [Thermoanaerobaculia bacterium]|nr:N-acetylmuramoyl-L-alanine amidase [Thermoanaerobaculia bacterium]
MKARRSRVPLLALCLSLPVLVAAQIAQTPPAPPVPQAGGPAPASPGRPTVVLGGRDLQVPVTIRPAGPVVALAPLAQALGGELSPDESGESSTLRIGETDIVLGVGSAIVTVGDQIVSLSQPVTRGEAGLEVPIDFLSKTWGDLSGYSFDWRPQEGRLAIGTRSAREIPVALDVVHLQAMTTVVLQFPEAPRYDLVQQPGVIEVRMLEDRLAPPADLPQVKDPLVQGVSITPQGVRLQLTPGAAVESYVLENPFRLVFDVHQPSTVTVPGGPPVTEIRDEGGIRTIVIDPGHGGTETGAIGPSGVAEKELTLILARDLEARLEQRLPVRVILTRNEDANLHWDTRAAIANQNRADLFISVHLNSSLGSGARGAETYFLSTQASDARAARAAEAENQGDATPPPGAEGLDAETQQDLQMILWDLAQTRHLTESQRFAGMVQAELNQTLQIRDRGVKQAPFRVLVGADMPAVLVELGFLSNPEEETKLQDPAYRSQLIDALVQAIARYKQTVDAAEAASAPAPPGTAPRATPGATPGTR